MTRTPTHRDSRRPSFGAKSTSSLTAVISRQAGTGHDMARVSRDIAHPASRTLLRAGIGLSVCMGLAASGGLAGCANTVTVSPPLKTLIFKITVGGQVRAAQEVRYILAIDSDGDGNDGPRPYGPWPRENPIIGWDLPFYLIPETQVPREFFNPPIVQPNTWTNLFMFTQSGGQAVFQHWVSLPDRQLIRRIEQRQDLVPGQDWKLTSSTLPAGGVAQPGTADTLELTLLLNRYVPEEELKNLSQLEANLVIQTTPPPGARDYIPAGWKVDQWFVSDTDYFTIPLDKNRPAERREALDAAPQFPQNKPAGFPDPDVTLKSYSTEYRETAAGQ